MDYDWLEIGGTPADEKCEQCGPLYDARHAKKECRAFQEAIEKKLGPPPEGAFFKIRSNPHDFGTYHELAVYFDPSNEEAQSYAYKVESDAPTTWAEVGMTAPTKE